MDSLRKQPGSNVPEFVQVMKHLYEDVKERLVTSDDKDVPSLRGEAKSYKRLIDMFTRTSLKQ